MIKLFPLDSLIFLVVLACALDWRKAETFAELPVVEPSWPERSLLLPLDSMDAATQAAALQKAVAEWEAARDAADGEGEEAVCRRRDDR